MEGYNLEYQKLVEKIKSIRAKETFFLLAGSLLMSVALALFALSLITWIETVALGDVAFRTVLVFVVIATFAVGFGFFTVPVLARIFGIKNSPSIYDVAMRIGNHYPQIKDKLSNALQLIPIHNKKNNYNTSQGLAVAAFELINEEIQNKKLDVIIDKKRFKKSLFLFLIAFILFLVPYISFQGTFAESFYRLQNFRQSFLPPAPFEISIEPLFKKAVRGEDVEIIVNVKGEAPNQIFLHLKEEQQKEFSKINLKLDSENQKYTYKISSIKNQIEFYGEAEWMNSSILTKTGSIKIIDYPVIRSISGLIDYPNYTNLASKEFNEQNADVTALNGTNVSFSIFANKPIKSAEVIFISEVRNDTLETASFDSTNYKMDISDRMAKGNLRVSKSGRYFFKIEDENGFTNENPINYNVLALTDSYPSISLLDPIGNVEISKDAIISIVSTISDDYGFSSLNMYYKLVESKFAQAESEYTKQKINIASKETVVEVPYLWDLNDLYITPGDKYEFYLEVADNDIVNGPKTARTKTITVKLPSLDELLSEAEKSQENIQEEMEKVLEETEELQKEIEKFNRDLKQKQRNEDLNWEEKKKAEDILKKQEDIKEKFEKIQQQLEDTSEKLKENQLMSQETLEKFMEMQKMMKEINSEELKKYQEQVQQALDQMTPDQLKQAMDKFEFNEDQFKKSIERTMKMLQRLQAEQKMDALSKRADELAEKQDELQKQLENSNLNNEQKKDELTKKQDALKDEMNSLEKDMNSLENLMEKFDDEQAAMEDFKEAEESLNSEQTKQEMQKASEQMQKNNKSEAQKSQEKASNNLKDFSKKMQQMKEQMSKSANKEAVQKMKKAINDIIDLSKKQEQLKNQAMASDNSSTQVPQMNKDQAGLEESLIGVVNDMMKLSEKTMALTPEMGREIGNALQKMRSAMDNMADRRMRNAGKDQSDAMGSLNKAGQMMQDMLGNMQGQGEGQGSGSGEGEGMPGQGQMSFNQRMQQLAGQQQMINQSMQQMMQQGQGGKLSQEEQAQMGRLSEKQGKAQKSMEELAKEQKEKGGSDRKTLGDLDRIKDEMKEVLNDMESGDVSQETLLKQERILSRLLDATRSINERDFEKKREGKTGKDYDLASPGEIDFKSDKGKELLFKELIKSLNQGYTKDYQLLIRQYFESLENNRIN